MKQMISKAFLIISFLVLTISSVVAQTYITTFGVRLGNNTDFRMAGLSFQQLVLNKVTIEGIIQSDFQKNTTLHLLAESHQNIISKRLNFYVGAGVSGGYEEFSQKTLPVQQNKTFGADLIAGLEVTLLHWNISVDYKPNFNITGRESWYQGQVGISVRGVVISDAALRKHKREKAREQKKKEREKTREKKEKDQVKAQSKQADKPKEKPKFEDVIKDLLK
jgi:hypothetical protein